MKNTLILLVLFAFSGCDTVQQVINASQTTSPGLSNQDIINGLKQALTIGTQNTTSKLSAVDGFFANAAVKILMPPEAQKVESTLRSLGLGSVVDKAVLSMNRAAEDAAKSATPIFVDAIKQMTIPDALGILKGSNTAATDYFKNKTTQALTNAFKPHIDAALAKVNATKYWSDVFTLYNKFSNKPVNTDLSAYVTGKAIDGIFYQVAQEETAIRKDPAARVTDLLKKVFGSTSAQK
ncbi:DUF4197 domain-containing protein [Danxiaibacter flavus]|uniref:DUF4197 domain-containing protein n=2 Tax=Danxiaibacter flavus TaxID=3049108 RepID=A0ABV3ZGH6_9BACT